jgi:hypothetical protein
MMALLPDFSASISPHDLQAMSAVVCENTIAFSLHLGHWIDRKELLGFGIMMLSRFIAIRSPACGSSGPASSS